MKIKLISAVIAAGTILIPAAQAQLTYTENGGNISGSLNGVDFSDATWTISVTADPATATYYNTGDNSGAIWTPVWAMWVTPTITITSGSTVLSATLPNWDIESRDYSFNPPSSAGAIMFSDANADGNGGVEQGYAAYITGTSANFNNLQSTGTFTGTSDFDNLTFATSIGDLVVNSDSGNPGTFVISAAAVPEPSTFALSALGGIGFLLMVRCSSKTIL